jgi:hypothetical protein
LIGEQFTFAPPISVALRGWRELTEQRSPPAVLAARDFGDIDRFGFYDRMKTYTAAPPDVLWIDEKHVREYAIFNVCGVIITTNHKADGIYLSADDRRHYVA